MRQAQECEVESSTVIEIELIRLVDHRLRIDRRAEVHPAGRNAADHAWLGSQRKQIDDALFRSDVRDALGHADAKIHDAVGLQFQCGAVGDDLALRHRHRGDDRGGHSDFAGERRAVGFREGLQVVFGPLGDHDAFDENAGHFHLSRVQAAAFGNAFHLHDNDAAGIARRHRDRQRLQRQRFALHRDVAVRIGGGAAKDPHVDRKRAVEEILIVADLHQRDDILGCGLIDLAPAEAWIDESADPDSRQQSRLARRDVAKKVRDDALRKIVGLDLVGDRQRLQLGHEPPVAADHALDESLVAEVIQSAIPAVALSGGVDERQVARTAQVVWILTRRLEVAFFERDGDVLRKADADESSGGQGVPVANQRNGLARADDLAMLERVQHFQQLPRVGRRHRSFWEPWPTPLTADAMPSMADSTSLTTLSFLLGRLIRRRSILVG